jgi:hypothetical protein
LFFELIFVAFRFPLLLFLVLFSLSISSGIAQTVDTPPPGPAAATEETTAPGDAAPDTARSDAAAQKTDDLLKLIAEKSLGPAVTLAVLSLFAWPFLKRYEEAAKQWQLQRELAQMTTAQVSKLAGSHYWALSNQAGTTANILKDYITGVEKHIFVTYTVPMQGPDASESIRLRMTELSNEAAENSLRLVAKLWYAFDEFQNKGSNTYLLPNHGSGEALRRLYNQFAHNIPENWEFHRDLLAYGGHLNAQENPASAPDAEQAEVNDDASPSPSVPHPTEKLRAVWQSWLRNSLPEVTEAAEALDAYANLLAVELAYLNEPFFKDRKRGARNFLSDDFELLSENLLTGSARRFGASEWPGLLDDDTLRTILRSKYFSRSFRQVGRMGDEAGAKGGLADEKRREESPDKWQGERGSLVG